jgi:hypothetical protein
MFGCMFDLVPPAGFEPALTAPEAAVARGRILPLTWRDAGGVSARSGDRSAHVPDHGRCFLARDLKLQRELIASS